MDYWNTKLDIKTFLGLLLPLSIAFSYASTPPASDGHGPPADAHAPAAEAHDHDPHGDEAVESEPEVESNRIVVLEPRKIVDLEAASAEIVEYIELARSLWRGGDLSMAEQYFSAALGAPTNLPEKEDALLAMGELYQESKMYPKAAATLERLTDEFPKSRQLASVYMELGHLYRIMGGLEIAISKYYMVLNASLNVSVDQVEKHRALSLKAKLEIANTHVELLEYDEAYRQYELLSRLELQPEDRMLVRFKICNLLYNLSNYQKAVSSLKLFLDQYPWSPHAPEIRYMLARSYEKLDRKPEALREVVQILQRQSSPDTALVGDEDSSSNYDGDYWRQRMGNELANEFYEQGDFRSALTIYQSLAKYNATPDWRWPAIHQIGLCFERLGLPEKAIMAYQEILNPENADNSEGEVLNPSMQSLRDMAKWRLEHLNWQDDLVARLNVLGAQ